MARRFSWILALLIFSVSAFAADPPSCILLIRHAEKPAKGDGVDLTPQGKQRAAMLPDLFVKSDKRPDPFPLPDFLYAAKNSDESSRPVETLMPLSDKLMLKLHQKIKNKDYQTLATELLGDPKFSGKTILVAWHHGTMPMLAAKLGATGFPDPFPSDTFDRVWQLNYDRTGKVMFRNRPQALLSGDSQ